MAKKGPKCACTPGGFIWLAIGAIVVGLGIFSIVKGFMMQQANAGLTASVLWYAIGIFVMCIGKVLKKKGCESCPVHKS